MKLNYYVFLLGAKPIFLTGNSKIVEYQVNSNTSLRISKFTFC